MLHPDLEAAIAALAGHDAEVSYQPRAVRLGIDYALRISGAESGSDAFAFHCYAEGVRRHRDDAPGDPPPDRSKPPRAENGSTPRGSNSRCNKLSG